MPETSPFHDLTTRAGATFLEEAGWLMPARFGATPDEYRQARNGAALFDVSHRGKVEITGADAVTFVQNFSTNDIARLHPGSGCETFFTTVQAKVVAFTVAYRFRLPDQPDAVWLDSAPGTAPKIIRHLDHYLISEQVELADRTREFSQLHLAGPGTGAVLAKALGDGEIAPWQVVVRTGGAHGPSQVRRHDALGLPGYDLVVPANQAEELWTKLTQAGAFLAGLEVYEILRVEAGTPEFGKDIDDNTLAPEVGRTRQAICYTKGCFLGQEPLVRIRDLGHVNRSLAGLKLEGPAAAPHGARIFQGDKEVGQVTSSVASPGLKAVIALAYLRRGHQDPGKVLEVEAQGGRRAAEVVSLPFSGAGAGRS
jgi:folate-binding protein YgfZ